MTVWRIKLNSKREETGLLSPDWDSAKRYCREHGLVGVGWGLEGVSEGASYQEVLAALAKSPHKDQGTGKHTLNRFVNEVSTGDLMWTRDKFGQFWLCEITGDWAYDTSGGSIANDLYNIRPAHWHQDPFMDDEVPGAVIRAFSGPGTTLCRIGDHQAALRVSEQLWKLRNEPKDTNGGLVFTPQEAITDLLDPKDVEDLVLLYLQAKGWLLLPSSRRRDTPVFEAELRKPSGEACVVSVKTGPTNLVPLGELDAAAGPRLPFAYSSHGSYSKDSDRVVKIETEQLVNFVAKHPALLPPRLSRWLAL